MKRWPSNRWQRSWTAIGASLGTFLIATIAVSQLVAYILIAIYRLVPVGRMPVMEQVFGATALLLGLFVGYRFAQLVFNVFAQPRPEENAAYCGRCGYDLTGNVSGRCPECGMDDVGSVLWHLERRERIQRLKTASMIAFGVPLSLLGPVVLATMFWLALRLTPDLFPAAFQIQWFGILIVLTIVMVPLLYRLELQTRGDYLSTVMRETEVHGVRGFAFMPGPAREIVALGAVAVNPRATASLFVELFLFGPHIVVGELRQRKLAQRVRLVERSRAAGIVLLLLRRGTGVETASLVSATEDLDDIMPTLAYLAFHQWIGVGDNWQRIWLYSEAKRLLQRA